METLNITIYKQGGEKIHLDGVNAQALKSEIAKKNYDGTYTMTNGDLLKVNKK